MKVLSVYTFVCTWIKTHIHAFDEDREENKNEKKGNERRKQNEKKEIILFCVLPVAAVNGLNVSMYGLVYVWVNVHVLGCR